MNITGNISTLSDKLLTEMQRFSDFIEADSIQYTDHGCSESLTITKNNKTFAIRALGNRFDGGFFGYTNTFL